ncbi:MAG: hypothetical protein IKC01_06735 [Clostridia bacterium]|nr:hypothetical protein [Clostridia bacterium]
MKKKVIIMLLASIMLTNTVVPAFAGSEAKLFDMYGNNMLFQQKAVSEIAGTGSPNSKIDIEIINSKNEIVIKSTGKVNSNGNFSVPFTAPEGSFEKYKIIIKSNEKEIAVLENILFGELWVASGQSNMHYPLGHAEGGSDDHKNKVKQSEFIRVMTMPIFDDLVSEDGSVNNLPLTPCEDIEGAEWVTGESENFYSVSAVAFYFASKLMDELDVPVGYLNALLGGTPITTWLSRDTIESNDKVKAYLEKRDMYIPQKSWKKRTQDIYLDMSANYNLRIAPIQKFAVSGMIWYQGESDIMISASPEEYALEFSLLQDSYSKLFGFKDRKIPVIFTQLAPYFYSEDGMVLPERNVAFSEIQKQAPESRALVTSYDVTPTFIEESGYIHPKPKREIGERMAVSALSLVYGRKKDYTLAYVNSIKTEKNAILVTFDNTGDGLIKKGAELNGFSICGSDGVYVNAKAEIISENTVKISSPFVKNPKSATYAYSVTNNFANLYSSNKNAELLPVSPFITNNKYKTFFWKENHWINCETKEVWHNDGDVYSGYYPSWESKNAEIEFSSKSAYKSDKGMNIKATGNSFSVNPLMTYKENCKEIAFRDVETDYSHYGKLRFYVKNNGSKKVTFEGADFCKSALEFYTPVIDSTSNNEKSIPADGKWHEITLDLKTVNLRSNDCGVSYSNSMLTDITNIRFNFSSEAETSDLSLDSFYFAPSETVDETKYEADSAVADNIFQRISAFFVNLIGKYFKN